MNMQAQVQTQNETLIDRYINKKYKLQDLKVSYYFVSKKDDTGILKVSISWGGVFVKSSDNRIVKSLKRQKLDLNVESFAPYKEILKKSKDVWKQIVDGGKKTTKFELHAMIFNAPVKNHLTASMKGNYFHDYNKHKHHFIEKDTKESKDSLGNFITSNFIDKKGKYFPLISKGRKQSYSTLLNHLKNHGISKKRISNVNADDLKSFLKWFKEAARKTNGESYTHNTITSNQHLLNTALYKAHDDEVISSCAFLHDVPKLMMQSKAERMKKDNFKEEVYIPLGDFDALFKNSLKASLSYEEQIIFDCFVIQILCGVHYNDVKQVINGEVISDIIDGYEVFYLKGWYRPKNYRIADKAFKGHQCVTPLFNRIVAPRQRLKEYFEKNPMFFNVRYNNELKAVLKRVGMSPVNCERIVSKHLRSSCSTNMDEHEVLGRDVSVAVLGHRRNVATIHDEYSLYKDNLKYIKLYFRAIRSKPELFPYDIVHQESKEPEQLMKSSGAITIFN
jgi:hypothetical protein